MTKEEYTSQFGSLNEYMAAIRKDWFEEFGEEISIEYLWFALKEGMEVFDPERYERIFG